MLREMSAMEWSETRAFMELSPSGEELHSIRTGMTIAAIWNVQIAKNKGRLLSVMDLIPRFGDTPEYGQSGPRRPSSQKQLWDNIKTIFMAMGKKKINKEAAQ